MDEDLELIEKFRSGDENAFGDLLTKYYKTVLNLIYRFHGRGKKEEAEDLAQEVFLRLFRSLGRFEARARFFTYLYRITLNLCLKAREKEGKCQASSLERLDDDGEKKELEIRDGSPGVDEELETKEMQRAVREAVRSLPGDQRAVVILHRYHDLSYEEIAEVLRISLPAVKSRLHRARLALRERLAPYMEGN